MRLGHGFLRICDRRSLELDELAGRSLWPQCMLQQPLRGGYEQSYWDLAKSTFGFGLVTPGPTRMVFPIRLYEPCWILPVVISCSASA